MSSDIPKPTNFLSGSLMRHVVIMSLTSSMGIMAIYVVDLCDIFFISLLGQKQMAAAAGFASAVMFFISAVNVGIAMAAAVLVANAIGADQDEKAREIATAAGMVSLCVAILFSGVLLLRLDGALAFVGATGEIAQMAHGYLWIVLPSSLLSGLSMVAVSALRSDGQAKWAMYPSLIGALVNLVLDPIFIFLLDLGLNGAAMATVAARIATLAIALFACTRIRVLFAPPSLACLGRHFWALAKYAPPAVLSSLAAPLGMAIITKYMAAFGAGAVAGMAIVGRLYPVVFSVVNALSGAVSAIVGQNFGAGKTERVEKTLWAALSFLAAYVFAMGLLLLLFRPLLAQAFSLEGLAVELLYLFCWPLSIIAFFNGTIMIGNAFFANMGYPRFPMWMQWARNTLGIIPFVAFGSWLWGPQGVFIGATIGGAVFAAFALFLVTKLISRIRETGMQQDVIVPQSSAPAPSHQSGWEG